MSSFNKRLSKRKNSKVTLKHHKKSEDSSQSLTQGAPAGDRPIRSEDIKMHSH